VTSFGTAVPIGQLITGEATLRRSVTAAALVAATTVGMIGGATLFASGGASATKTTCHLWAVVNANGTVSHSGCPAITATQVDNPGTVGDYSVTFPKDVANCAVQAATVGVDGGLAPVLSVTNGTVELETGTEETAGWSNFSIVATC